MNLGNKINEIRKENNMSQEEFAEALNVSRQTVSNWENYKNYPDIATIILISNKFNISLDILLKGDKKMIKDLDKKIKSFSKIKIFIIIIVILLGYILYNKAYNYYNYHYTPINSSENISIRINAYRTDKNWNFQVTEPNIARVDFSSTTYDRNGEKINLVFLTCYSTLSTLYEHGTETYNYVSDLDHKHINLDEKIEVYYTPQKVSKHTINDLSEEELTKIISNSTLIFDNTIKNSSLNCTLNNETYNYNFSYYNTNGQIIGGNGDLTIPKSINLFENYSYFGFYTDTRDIIKSLQDYFTTNNGTCTLNNDI